MQYPIYNLLCAKNNGAGMSICRHEEITSVTQITHKQVLYQRASGENGTGNYWRTENTDDLIGYWLCVCYYLRVFGCHPQGSRTGKLNDSLGMCLYFWRVVLLCTSTMNMKKKIPGDLHDCCWFTKLYLLHFRVLILWSKLQVKRAVRWPNAISNQNNHLH